MKASSFIRFHRIGNLKFKNRLFRSATWEGLALQDGSLSDEIYSIYDELAKGGVGTIITGLTDVYEHSQALTGNMRLYSNLVIDQYRKLTDICHQHDCNIITQINMDYYETMSDDGVLYQKDIDQLTIEDINHIVKLFLEATTRSLAAGFDGIQLHLAFNWLLNRSFNPEFNHRTDEYGGDMKKRCKLIVDILKTIRQAYPDLFIIVKVGFYYNLEDQQAIKQYITVCKELEKNKINAIEISCNNHLIGKTNQKNEAAFLPLAKIVAKNVNVPLILVGRNRHRESMEDIINNTSIDYLSMSRSLINEPELPKRWESGDINPSRCIPCDMCFKVDGKRCCFNQK